MAAARHPASRPDLTGRGRARGGSVCVEQDARAHKVSGGRRASRFIGVNPSGVCPGLLGSTHRVYVPVYWGQPIRCMSRFIGVNPSGVCPGLLGSTHHRVSGDATALWRGPRGVRFHAHVVVEVRVAACVRERRGRTAPPERKPPEVMAMSEKRRCCSLSPGF
eukprot:1180945-Prorocentrum_minimum.AAC.3